MSKRTTTYQKNFQTVRRFLIVQMNQAGLDSLERMRVLQLVQLHLSEEQIAACATAISSKQHRSNDLVHDIMGLARQEIAFLPRIHSIAEAA